MRHLVQLVLLAGFLGLSGCIEALADKGMIIETDARQVTGERIYDFNEGGVAHYGLFAGWVNAVGHTEDGASALQQLFCSAVAYLQMWERTR